MFMRYANKKIYSKALTKFAYLCESFFYRRYAMRTSFIFYSSFYEALEDLPQEMQLQLYRAITRYSLFNEELELEGIANTIFKLIKPQLDANNKRYENGKKGGQYGKLGGRPKNQKPQKETNGVLNKTPNEPQENPKETPNVNVNDNDNVNDNLSQNGEREIFEKETNIPQSILQNPNIKNPLAYWKSLSEKDKLQYLELDKTRTITNNYPIVKTKKVEV